MAHLIAGVESGVHHLIKLCEQTRRQGHVVTCQHHVAEQSVG